MGPAAHKIIDQAIVRLFQKLRERTLGNYATGKTLELTLKGIFDAAAAEEGSKPSSDTLASLLKVSSSYIDAAEAKTRAKLAQAVQAHLQEAKLKGVKTDFRTVLAGKLEEALGEAQNDVKRILQTESTIVRNVSLADGISKANAAVGIDDPTVFFVTVNDSSRCAECTRLHVQPDGVTPRVWKMSELGTGYHKRGDSTPKVGGLHPHCRCILTTLMPGYGFNAAGRVTYKAPSYSEYEAQHGTETLQKSTKRGLTVTFNPLREHLKALRADREAQWAKKQEESSFENPIPHESVERLIEKAPISINFPRERVNDFLKEGRLKNLLETGTGMGATDKELRAAHENALFNIPTEAPGAVRPLYGALNLLHTHNKAIDHFGPAPSYGDAWLVLKPHVKERSTVTPSDSFNHDFDDVELADHSYLIASRHARKRRRDPPLLGVQIALNNHEHDPDLFGGIPHHDVGEYIEAQIHGGIRMKDDVAEIHFRPLPNTNVSTMKALVDHHQNIRKAAEDFSRKFKVPAFIHHHDFNPKHAHINPRTGKLQDCDPEMVAGRCDPSHWRVEEVRAWEKQPEADLKKSTFHGMKSLHNMQERLHSNKKMHEGPTDFGELEPYRERFLAAPVTVNLPARALSGLIESGRLKNQFETGTTLGSSCLKTRKEVERNVFDIPEEAQDGERPVYGAIHLHHDDPILKHLGGASEYGNLWLKLKPHVHERTTVTKGDSFGETPAYAFEDRALPLMKRLNNPYSGPSLIGHLTGKTPMSVNWGYSEAQIHGGVGLAEDVDELHIGSLEYRSFPAQEKEVESLATALGKKYGVKVIAHRRKPYGDDDKVKEVVLHDPHAPTSTPETSPTPPEAEKSSGQG